MSNWSTLLHDLLVLIARRVNLIEDYLNFSSVCKSWHAAATKQNFNGDLPRAPWMMLAEEEFEGDKFRPFLSLYNGKILKKRIPKASGKLCLESLGWLIINEKDGLQVSLIHPFSGVHIELPRYESTNQRYLMSLPVKAVLSANPSHTSNYVLMVMDGGYERFLAFWRPGDLTWTRIIQVQEYPDVPLDDVLLDDVPLDDVVYFNGRFYTIDSIGRILACDVASLESHMVAELPPNRPGGQSYILESLGSLFVVIRDIQYRPFKNEWSGEEDSIHATINFSVFQIDLVDGRATETKELGERAFFLGANSSLSVQASQCSGVKPNHIYFTDDFPLWDPFGDLESLGLDNGAFNLADGSIQYYEVVYRGRICPPTWVTPTLY